MFTGRDKPIHLLGIADLQSIGTATPFGMDTFDSSYPTKVRPMECDFGNNSSA
jgi:queuine tRNA-ribosyltransferase